MKKYLIIAGLIILALLILNPFTLMIVGIEGSIHQTKIIEAKLQKPEYYEPTARLLALYCQSDRTNLPGMLSSSWLPRNIAKLGDPWCEVGSDAAHVEFGGGFYHFGYSLDLDKGASTPSTNVWSFYLVREQSPDKFLMTLSLASTNQMSADKMESIADSNYSDMIKGNEPEGYKGRVMLRLRFGHVAQSAAACRDWINANPDSWLARFTYAHIRCRMGEAEPAAADFTSWVNMRHDFSLSTYLALFNYREDRTNQAIEAVRQTLKEPFVETAYSDANKFYFAQNDALVAYSYGDYALSIAMCDKMLADKSPVDKYDENVWDPQAFGIKAAATLMIGDKSTAINLMGQAQSASSADPIESQIALDKLAEAIQRGDKDFVRDFGNWMGDYAKWYSPFEVDETGFHGVAQTTPYPASWKSDRMKPDSD